MPPIPAPIMAMEGKKEVYFTLTSFVGFVVFERPLSNNRCY